MRMNVEIDLDWIDEESNIDDTVKNEIINRVSKQIQDKIEKTIEVDVNNIINKTVVTKINERTDAMFDEFATREVSITDKYGDKVEFYKSITDLMKKRFDNFMIEKVDEKGHTYTGGYGKSTPRLEFIIDSQLKKFADEFTTNAVKTVSAEIKEHVREGLTTKLGAELMSVLKVNEMLSLPMKK